MIKLVVNKNEKEHIKDTAEQKKIDEVVQYELNQMCEKVLELVDIHSKSIPDCTDEDILNAMAYCTSIWLLRTFTENQNAVPPRDYIWSALKLLEYHMTNSFSEAIGYNPQTDI